MVEKSERALIIKEVLDGAEHEEQMELLFNELLERRFLSEFENAWLKQEEES